MMYNTTSTVLNTKTKVEKLHKHTVLGALLFFTPLFSACDSILPKSVTSQHSEYYSILPQDKNTQISKDFMQISLLDSIRIKSTSVNSVPIKELSDLVWDRDENLLYAISDEGYLYHLQISVNQDGLKSAKVIFATRLKNENSKKLKGKYSDSEGLAITNANNGIKGDSQLIISFENKPRIAYYSPNGAFIKKASLPKDLGDKKYYRSKNKALESVTFHPKYGILTAAEYPLKRDPIKKQSIYSSTGQVWHFPASQATNSAITALEVLPNGDILVLERAYKDLITPIEIFLRRVKLNQCDKQQNCNTQIVAHFNGADGWLLDNFEGLTHYKGDKYFMVSDDNGNPLQNTILIMFEIKSTE